MMKKKTMSPAQVRAIKANYVRRDKLFIPVDIKTHRDNNRGHYHVIMGSIVDRHVSVGLTTKPTKGKGSKNYKMEKDPLNRGCNSYMRRQGYVCPKVEYHSPRKGEMSVNDFAKAKIYAARAEAKYNQGKKV